MHCGSFGARHAHARARDGRAAPAMCALSLSCASVADTGLESWEGADPSQSPTVAEIIIGKVKVKVSRSRISNPVVLGPAPRPFSLLFA